MPGRGKKKVLVPAPGIARRSEEAQEYIEGTRPPEPAQEAPQHFSPTPELDMAGLERELAAMQAEFTDEPPADKPRDKGKGPAHPQEPSEAVGEASESTPAIAPVEMVTETIPEGSEPSAIDSGTVASLLSSILDGQRAMQARMEDLERRVTFFSNIKKKMLTGLSSCSSGPVSPVQEDPATRPEACQEASEPMEGVEFMEGGGFRFQRGEPMPDFRSMSGGAPRTPAGPSGTQQEASVPPTMGYRADPLSLTPPGAATVFPAPFSGAPNPMPGASMPERGAPMPTQGASMWPTAAEASRGDFLKEQRSLLKKNLICYDGKPDAAALLEFFRVHERYLETYPETFRNGSEAVQHLSGFLQQDAARWFESQRRIAMVPRSLEEFKRMLCAKYYPSNVRNTTRSKLSKLAFDGSGMTGYVAEFNSVVAQAADVLGEGPLPEDDLVRYFLAGLRRGAPGLGDVGRQIHEGLIHYRSLRMMAGASLSLEELQRYAEAQFRSRGLSDRSAEDQTESRRPVKGSRAQVNAAGAPQPSRRSRKRPYEPQGSRRPAPKPKEGAGDATCFACRKSGHFMKDCPELKPVLEKLARTRKVAAVTHAMGRAGASGSSGKGSATERKGSEDFR